MCDVATLRGVIAQRIPAGPSTQPAVDAIHRLLDHADLARNSTQVPTPLHSGQVDQRPLVRVGFFGTSIMEHRQAVSAALLRQADLPPIGSKVAVDGWEHRGWPRLLLLSLRARHPHLRFEVSNRAAGGATSRDVAAVIRADPILADDGYDLVFVGCGINDVWRAFQQRPEAVGRSEYLHLMDTTVDRLRRTCRKVIVVGETPFGPVTERHVVEAMNTDLAAYTTAVQSLAATHGVVFVNLWEPFLEAAGQLGSRDPLWSDGVHLTELGDTLIVQQVERILAEQALLEDLSGVIPTLDGRR